MTTAIEVLRQIDVTSAAWRLTLDAAWGKPVRRDAAIRTLIAAGADADAALALTGATVGIASAQNQVKPHPPRPS
jgi:hypothetical protein